MPCKVEPAELAILLTKEYSKLYFSKHSIVDKISVYSWPKNVVKQQHFIKQVHFKQSMSGVNSELFDNPDFVLPSRQQNKD